LCQSCGDEGSLTDLPRVVGNEPPTLWLRSRFTAFIGIFSLGEDQ